jgi:hypothetical protein
MSDLAILCVTRFGAHAEPFLRRFRRLALTLNARCVIGADGPIPRSLPDGCEIVHLRSAGYIESVLDVAIEACDASYILRLDDDETVSAPMLRWLRARAYERAQHWAFPRMHLWPDHGHYVADAPLWPDLQTRLSVKEFSGGRHHIHAGSPHGTGEIAPVPILHHKFLVRSREEREALLREYERIQPGAGEMFAEFSVPEHCDKLDVRPRR